MIVVAGGTRNCASQYNARQVKHQLTYANNQCSHNSSRGNRGSEKLHDKNLSRRKNTVSDGRQRLFDDKLITGLRWLRRSLGDHFLSLQSAVPIAID